VRGASVRDRRRACNSDGETADSWPIRCALWVSRRAHFERRYGSGQYVLLHDRESFGAKRFEAHLAACGRGSETLSAA
jgi:hypothetical protein